MPKPRKKPLKLYAFAASAFVLSAGVHPLVPGTYTQTTGTVPALDADGAEEAVRDMLHGRGEYLPPAYGDLCVSVCEIPAATCAAFAKE